MSAAGAPHYRAFALRHLCQGVNPRHGVHARALASRGAPMRRGGGGGGGACISLSAPPSVSGRHQASTNGRIASLQWTELKHQHQLRWGRGVCAEASAEGGELITSTSNATVKHFAKLVKNRAYRDACGSVVVAGSTLLEEIYGAGGIEVDDAKTLILAEDAETPPGVRARRIVYAPSHVMKKAAGLQSVDRVDAIAEIAMPPLTGLTALSGVKKIKRLLAMDAIQDPGNLGTLVRTSLALGWDAIVLLPGTCDPYNDKALRAARGSVFRLPMARLTWEEFDELTTSHKLSRFCAEPEAPDAVDADATRAAVSGGGSEFEGLCLVLGSEGQGLSDTALNTCQPVGIPMPGEMESLNVSIAGGILMYLMRP